MQAQDDASAPEVIDPRRIDQVVMPGDSIGRVTSLGSTALRLGNGIVQDGELLVCTKSGYLRCTRKRTQVSVWVENNQRRYVPAPEDMVIGIVTDRVGEAHRVDIASAAAALLPALAFEGATKKYRPPLVHGSLVYARVVQANKDMETELSCIAVTNRADGFGELTGGYMFQCSLALARSLLSPTSPILSALGQRIPYELAVGINGRVWVRAGSATHTVLIANAILNSEFLAREHIDAMVNALVERAKFALANETAGAGAASKSKLGVAVASSPQK